LEGDSKVKVASLIITCYTDEENLGLAAIIKTFQKYLIRKGSIQKPLAIQSYNYWI